MSGCRAPFPTRAHAAGGIGWSKGFATGAHKFEMPDAATKAELAKKPALAIWGEIGTEAPQCFGTPYK